MNLLCRINRVLTRAVYGGFLGSALMPFALLGFAGCAAPTADHAEAATDAVMVGGETGTPGQSPVRAVRLNLLASARAEYAARTASGDIDPSRRLVIEHVGVPPTGQAGEWTIRRPLVDAGGHETSPGRTQHVARLADGSIVLMWEENAIEKVEVTFEPPMLVMPAELRPGAEPPVGGGMQTVHMTVYPLGDRSHVKAQGQATNEIRLAASPADVKLAGAKTVKGWALTSELNASLGPAKVRNVTVQWFGVIKEGEEGVELLAERREEATKVLGIQNRHTLERWARIE